MRARPGQTSGQTGRPARADAAWCASGRMSAAMGVDVGSLATAGRARDHGSALSGALARAVARLWGAYALNVYLPGSASARRLRNLSRSIRGVHRQDQHATRLPQAPWRERLAGEAISPVE